MLSGAETGVMQELFLQSSWPRPSADACRFHTVMRTPRMVPRAAKTNAPVAVPALSALQSLVISLLERTSLISTPGRPSRVRPVSVARSSRVMRGMASRNVTAAVLRQSRFPCVSGMPTALAITEIAHLEFSGLPLTMSRAPIDASRCARAPARSVRSVMLGSRL